MSEEDDFRLSALVTSYGVGTRSYNRSAEKREMDRQRKYVTEHYVGWEIIVGPYCHCRSFHYPHELSAHSQLEDEWDWRTPEERANDKLKASGGNDYRCHHRNVPGATASAS